MHFHTVPVTKSTAVFFIKKIIFKKFNLKIKNLEKKKKKKKKLKKKKIKKILKKKKKKKK